MCTILSDGYCLIAQKRFTKTAAEALMLMYISPRHLILCAISTANECSECFGASISHAVTTRCLKVKVLQEQTTISVAYLRHTSNCVHRMHLALALANLITIHHVIGFRHSGKREKGRGVEVNASLLCSFTFCGTEPAHHLLATIVPVDSSTSTRTLH